MCLFCKKEKLQEISCIRFNDFAVRHRHRCCGQEFKPSMQQKSRSSDLSLFLPIREVPGLDLGSETGNYGWGCWWISSIQPWKCPDSTLYYTKPLSPKCFTPHYLLSILSFDTLQSELLTINNRCWWWQEYRSIWIIDLKSIIQNIRKYRSAFDS
jgi:hypothetical protein